MKAFRINTLLQFWLLLWINQVTSGQHFAPDQTLQDYAGFATGLGSLIGGIGKDEKPDLKNLGMSLNRMGAMMQGISGPDGAPPFADEKLFQEIEEVFTRMGPYVCLLPLSTPKNTNDLPPVLGGVIGGLIGAKVSEERLRKRRDFESIVSMMSGIGTIAGALGGMSGWEVVRGRFGKPKAKFIVEMVPEFVKKMGDMKSMLKGSFKPLSETKHKNLKLLVERDLGRATRKMSKFLTSAKECFKGNQTDATIQAKATAFDLRFRAVDSELAKIAKSVSSMAGVYGGIIGYVMPRFHEEKSDGGKGGSGNKKPLPKNNGSSEGNETVLRNEVDDVKQSLKTMRLKQTNSQRNGKNDKWDVFSGALNDLADSAGEIGGYSGVVGGMMGEVLANGAAAQAGKFLRWELKEEEDNDDERGSRVSKDDVLQKLTGVLPPHGINRLDHNQKLCIRSVALGLEHFGRLHKFGENLPGALQFNGPYGDEQDSVSMEGIRRRLIGKQLDGDWNRPLKKKTLNQTVSIQDLRTVIQEKDLEDNSLIEVINNIVMEKGADSKVVKLLTGKLSFKDASKDELQSIEVEVFAALKPTIVGNMTTNNFIDIFTSEKASRNPTLFKKFLMAATDEQMTSVLTNVTEKHDNKEWNIYIGTARVIADQLVDRFGLNAYESLCPFASGITSSVIKRASSDVLMETNLLYCMRDFKQDFPESVKKAIVDKALEIENISVEIIDSFKGFTDLFDPLLWYTVNDSQIADLIDSGHFLALKKICPVKRREIMEAIISQMNISSSVKESTKYLRNLGELMCGIPVSDLKDIVPSADLEDVKSNWTRDCITEPNKQKKEIEKNCAQNWGRAKGKCKKLHAMNRRNIKDRLNSYRWTRSSVKQGLKSLSEKLPLSIQKSVDGLTISEISRIPGDVLINSLDVVSENMKLSFPQRRKILSKLISAGKQLTTTDDLKEIGVLLTALDLKRVKANLTNKALTERPNLLMQFPKYKKFHLINTLYDDMTTEELINIKTPLSPLIPTYKLRELSSLNLTAISKMRWNFPQGLEIVNRFKTLNQKSDLSMEDIRALGMASVGITCQDVSKLPLSSMVQLSGFIDHVAGNDISPSLASCIATKLYLCIKMKCIKGSDINHYINKAVPGNILIFLPPTVLAHVSYGKHCVELIRKLGKAKIDLLSPGTGSFVISGMLQVAKICHDSFENKEETNLGGPTKKGFMAYSHKSNGKKSEQMNKTHGNMNDNQTDKVSPKPIKDSDKPSPRNKTTDKLKDGNPPPKSNSSNYKHHKKDNKRGPPQITGEDVMVLGKLVCSEGMFDESFSPYAMAQLSRVLPTCIKSITKESSEKITTMFQRNLKAFDGDYLTLRPMLGSLLPLVHPEFIEENISSTLAAILMQNLPPIYQSRGKRKPLVGDKSSTTLSFTTNLDIDTPNGTLEIDLDYEPINMSTFADAIFPKLLDYIKTKNKTGKDPAAPVFVKPSSSGDNSSSEESDEEVSRKRRQAANNESVETTTAAGSGEVDSESDESDDIEAFPENGITYELLVLTGPAIIGLKVEDIEAMSERLFKDSIPLMGKYRGWSKAQFDAIKSKMSVYGNAATWSSALLRDLGQLSPILDATNIESLENIDLESLGPLSRASWPSNDLRRALLYRYSEVQNKKVNALNGAEILTAGDLICGIDTADISGLNNEDVKFAFASLGRRRCFNEEKLLAFKNKALAAINQEITVPSVLYELGILGGAMTVQQFESIPPFLASLVSPDALRIVDANNIINGWNESHFALMGVENGAAIITRPDIFKALSNKAKNAVFRAAFGSNSGIMSTLIDLLKHGKERSATAFKNMLNKMLRSIAMLFNIMVPTERPIPKKGGPGSVYGLVDAENFVKPPPPEFAIGLSKKDFTKAFNSKFLEDNQLINFINKVSKGAQNLLDVMKGTKSFNDLAEAEIKEVPPTVFISLKVSELRSMSPTVVGSILDSPRAARDPTSMSKVIRRLDTSQFEGAMDLLNQKIKEASGSDKLWKPPIKTQEAMAKDYLIRLNKNNSVTEVEILDKFIENICSIVAGLPSWMFKNLPMVESKRKEALGCMEKSYKDLSQVQKKQIVKWAFKKPKNVKSRRTPDKKNLPSLQEVKDLGKFMMDIPVHQVRKALSEPQSALDLVQSGNVEKLDPLHPNFKILSKMTIRKLVNNSKEKFNDKDFLKKLGSSKCEIPLKKVKKVMNKDSMKYLANYTMTQCKEKETVIAESLKECEGEQALRLQRCQLLNKHASKTLNSKFKQTTKQQKKKRVGLDQFKMMRELANSLLGDLDLSKMNAEEIKNAAGALGGLNPMDMDKLPDDSILDAIDVIKDNGNLSPKQKKIMFRKVQKAGFSLDRDSSLADLGELVSEVPVADFLKISPESIKKNLEGLNKKAADFTPSQKRAIVGRLRNISMEEMLEDDLGAFAAEIPLKKIKSLRNVNLTQLKDQAWERDQASELIDIFLNSTDEEEIDVEMVSKMGTTVVGLKCRNIMDMQYFEAQETATLIDGQADMDPDMDECMQSKFHFSKQVELGGDYMTNDTEEADLETTLEAIPSDIALFYEPEVVNATPDALCDIIFQKIGEAQLSSLPPGPGDERRKELAEGAVLCLERNPDSEFTVLEEEDIEMLGNLICDVPAEYYKDMTSDAFDAALENMRNCLQWFTKDHVAELRTLIKTHSGEVATWDETTLASIGPLVAFMEKEDIENINAEHFASYYDQITPEIDPTSTGYSLMNHEAFYEKARETLTEDNEEINERRKRAGSHNHDHGEENKTPTYDNIVALGPGNSGWTVDELKRISDDDILAALDVLGSVVDWSSSQMEFLIEKIESAKSQKKNEWPTSDVADAKHILTDLTPDVISTLDISSLETTTALSDVAWSLDQRVAAFDVFMSKMAKTPNTLTSEDVAGLGTIFCGIDSIKLSTISASVVSEALKDLGKLTCYKQEQLDALYSLVYESNDNEFPDGALLNAMGSIAAGMTTEELQEIEVEDMPMLSVYAIELMSPLRFKDGMSTTQLGAAGVTNLAAVIRNKPVYEALSVEQRNTVNTAAYGRSANLEEPEATTTVEAGSPANKGDDDVSTTSSIPEEEHDDHHENRVGDKVSTTIKTLTTTSGAPIWNVSYCAFVLSSFLLYFFL